MANVVQTLKPVVDKTIKSLTTKNFTPDPIAGLKYSKIVSITSSSYKRHGLIIERAILERIKMCKNFKVWHDAKFMVSGVAERIVDAGLSNPKELVDSHTAYSAGARTVQVDLIVYNKKTKHLGAYEIKRGAGTHDSGKKRQMLRDVLCVQVLLKGYGKTKGLNIKSASSHVIFYYGKCSLPAPYKLTKKELDKHFEWPIVADVEKVNKYFQKKLFKILAN